MIDFEVVVTWDSSIRGYL